ARAREHLEELEAKLDEERRELGVADELREIPGITTAMMVALGKDGILTIEDLAGCATDDLVGWTERSNGDVTRHAGALSAFDVSRADAEEMIMAARIKAGWVTPEDLVADEDLQEVVEEEAVTEPLHTGVVREG